MGARRSFSHSRHSRSRSLTSTGSCAAQPRSQGRDASVQMRLPAWGAAGARQLHCEFRSQNSTASCKHSHAQSLSHHREGLALKSNLVPEGTCVVCASF